MTSLLLVLSCSATLCWYWIGVRGVTGRDSWNSLAEPGWSKKRSCVYIPFGQAMRKIGQMICNSFIFLKWFLPPDFLYVLCISPMYIFSHSNLITEISFEEKIKLIWNLANNGKPVTHISRVIQDFFPYKVKYKVNLTHGICSVIWFHRPTPML